MTLFFMSCDDIENEWMMMMMNKSINIKTGINYNANKKEREKKSCCWIFKSI